MRHESSSQIRPSKALIQQIVVLFSVWATHVAFTYARNRAHPGMLELILGSACLMGGFLGMRRLAARWPQPPAVSPLFVLVAVGTLLTQTAIPLPGREPSPLEVAVIMMIRNVMLALGAVSVWRQYQPMAMLLALFVSLFSLAMKPSWEPQVAVSFYAAGAVAWLSLSYWRRLEPRLLHRERRGQMPWWLGGLLVASVVAMLTLTSTGQTALVALQGFLRSSGGDGMQNAEARSGVGDGEALVRGEQNIQSFGPIEDAPFASSEQPSLYDVFNEKYDEPVKIRGQDRAVALPPEFATEVKQRMSRTEIATKEFTTNRRRGPKDGRRSKSLRSDALFHLKGRTPLHLKLESFDLFDGESWYAESRSERNHSPELTLDETSGRPWIRTAQAAERFEFFGPIESHAIKVARFDDNRLPSPPHLRSVHIDRLRDASMFEWVQPGQLAMSRKSLPPLTAIHLRSRTVHANRLRKATGMSGFGDPRYRLLPDGPLATDLQELGTRWTQTAKTDWERVDAILNRLKDEYTLIDPTSDATEANASVAADDSQSDLRRFLFETRAGEDYLFASAAVLLLRTQGIPSRLVRGFYASPDRFDLQREHTPVVKADAHFWVEVGVGLGEWTPLEPTPGYALLAPPPSWLARVMLSARQALAWAWGAKLILGIAAAIWLAIWTWRVPLLDRAGWLRWRCLPGRSPREQLLSTRRFIEFRLRLRGLVRPRGVPWARWIRQLPPDCAILPALEPLARECDWAEFGPDGAGPASDKVPDLCTVAVAAVRPCEFMPKRRPVRGGVRVIVKPGDMA